ncbi:MAG: thioredoxin [Planctomycetia bacterium]|nr:thioredoxin [Planctomycetia bacterium]
MAASTAFSFIKPDNGTSRPLPPPHSATATEKLAATSKAPLPVTLRRVESVTTRTFDEEVMKSASPVLVDFYADWCGPCQVQGRILDDLATQLQSAKIVKVNVDENADLARQFGVTALPTLVIIRDGKVIGKQVGLATKKQLVSAFAGRFGAAGM